MKMKYAASLLAATALSGVVMAAPAHAGKIEDLEAQIQLMQKQMAALQQAIAEAKAEASAANAAMRQENAVAVAAVKEDVKNSEAKVAEAVKKAGSPAPSVKIGGKMFANLSSYNEKKDGTKTDNSKAGLDIKRFYVSVDGKLNDTWSANVTTDFTSVNEIENVTTSSTSTMTCTDPADASTCTVTTTTTPGLTQGRLTQVFLKKAYVQAKLSDALTVRLGEADLPWMPFAEGLYGFRYVENVIADRQKVGSSAGWGVHAFGKFSNGMVNYAASVVNNANSYKDPSRANGVDFEGRIGLAPVKDITLGVGLSTGKLGKNTVTGGGENRTAVRWNAIAAYTGKNARAGIEYFNARNWNILAAAAEDKAEGWSGFASYSFGKTTLFGRYDETKTNKLTNASLKDTYYNAGLAYAVTKGIDIAAVFKHGVKDDYVAARAPRVVSNEFGVWTQLSF